MTRRSMISLTAINALVIAALVAPTFTPDLSTAASVENPYVWDEPVRVKRITKPKRKAAPAAPKTEKAPLLTLKWQVLKRADGNTTDRVDVSKPSKVGDQLKLSVTPNQNGFLYIIHRSTTLDGQVVDQPHLIFPDPRVNSGANAVKKDQR